MSFIADEVMAFEWNDVRVEWVNLGEGCWGDYDPDDPEDENLLRFDVSRLVDNNWEMVDDASYCTGISAETPRETLIHLLEVIMGEVYEPVTQGHSIKKICERLSWINVKGEY